MKPIPIFLAAFMLSAAFAKAQLELEAGTFNQLWRDGIPSVPGATGSQFSSWGEASGAVGPLNNSTVFENRYPSNGSKTIVLNRAIIGRTWASGVPRYNMGEQITPPLTKADGVTTAPENYWRVKPVHPGEIFDGVARIPLGTVAVTNASTSSRSVTVVSAGSLVVGASLLGQPIARIAGNTVTLVGNADTNISSSTTASVTPATSFYHSRHAEMTFAHQSGGVSITWVTRVPEGGDNKFAFKTEAFSVSSASSLPTRQILWTEAGFDGPKIRITDGRITTVSPIYNNQIPKGVAEEVEIPGYTPITANLKTLSFEKLNGTGELSAYNVEGRILVEYLGNLRSGSNVYEHLGFDLVEIKRQPSVAYVTTHLGKELVPHDGDSSLTASPVLLAQQGSQPYYGTSVRANSTTAYHAERETGPPHTPDDGVPASLDSYNKVRIYWLEAGQFNIQWPKFQDRYWLRWSPLLSDYAHYTVGDTGSTTDTGISFSGGTLPQLVYQDDPAQTEARIHLQSQRFYVNFTSDSDKRNLSLLKFTSGSEQWYVNVYSQSENRSVTRNVNANGTNTISLIGGTTNALEVGMVLTGPGSTGDFAIVSITNSTSLILSGTLSGDGNYNFTVQPDSEAPINAVATVGSRINRPAGHENAGYISSGTAYYPAGYINPFTSGVEAANQGAIIPVNNLAGNDTLTVRWFKKVNSPSTAFQSLYVPGKVGRYAINYDATPNYTIVIAQGVGTDDLSSTLAAGSVYYQNDSTQPGYNPNEEHAFMLGGRAYALRDDLNDDTTSEPWLLLAYTSPTDGRPNMRAFKVVRTSAQFDFNYVATAGTMLIKPYPLPLLPLPLTGIGTNVRSKDIEIAGTDDATNTSLTADNAYAGFTFQDRKGFTWVHRGPHSVGTPTLSMKLYYVSQPGFFIPGMSTQPSVGTILPFLRASGRTGQLLNLNNIDDGESDQPLLITYTPAWPDQTPELRVGETLALPKFGLPQVRGQSSAQILYQQSLANATSGLTKTSVTLHDPTREKTVKLDDDEAGVDLISLPGAIATTVYQGLTYFQGLPPHLQQRFYFDPMRSAKGTLVLIGEFHDVPAGEDYLDLNLLTAADETLLKDLVPSGNADRSKWDAAIEALTTRVETFKEDSSQAGSFIVDPSHNFDIGENEIVPISSPDSAVDSYAVTATGQATGYVTMVFGNGNAFTDPADPVQVKIFKVASRLYTGDLKVISSSNPLDEQVTLRHSADFAGKPEDYDYEWRWTTGEATAPAVYTTILTNRIGVTPNNEWRIVSDPGTMLPTSSKYADVSPQSLPSTQNVRPISHTDQERSAGLPGLVLKSETGVDFSGGVPGDVFFSASVGTLDGFVLYINGTAALAYNAPSPMFELTNSSTGLVPNGLAKQFQVPSSYFTAGLNRIEVAIYTNSDPERTSSLDFRLDAATETDAVASGSTWQTPTDPSGVLNTNTAIVGGSPTNPFGGSTFVLNDRWFTMRYKPKASANNVLGSDTWSRWMPPMFVEGWIKRVLAGINPFEQRAKDLFNNALNTDVSLLTQAGQRWEGDIALNLDNINEVGLIEIYETVLNRGKAMSIDANTNDPDSNNALLLAAGYLNDLYTLLGNEAYADAANPTISIDDQGSATQVNTSRFSFESQVASSLDEELALLRGRDDLVSPGVGIAPAYNRLYWNYTRGINSGEALYALNYNIKEKVGSSTANGVIDESDAQRMFPQGHGDAYGHYLTALKGYYKLLSNPNFTWTPRAEVVTVLGQPVTIDYMDERKFAAAAANLARSAQQVLSLTWRQTYNDDPSSGWDHLRDDRYNSQTAVTRRQGMDEWASRSGQGSLYHWAVANSMLPVTDNGNTGVRKIDRTTVPEIPLLASLGADFQATMDSANAHLNPLGLSPGAIAFDISPTELTNGNSHYEQISARALNALNNAAGAFDQAAIMTGALRNQEMSIDEFNTAIVEQENAFEGELISIYGQPYTGEIGAGKLYAQGYTGPDLFHWFIVDRPTDLVITSDSQKFNITVQEPTNFAAFTENSVNDILNDLDSGTGVTTRVVTFQPSQYVQYNDVWKSGGLGARRETGELQDALLDAQQTYLAVSELRTSILKEEAGLRQSLLVFEDLVTMHAATIEKMTTSHDVIYNLSILRLGLETASAGFETAAGTAMDVGETLAEFFPGVVGIDNDVTAPARGTSKFLGLIVSNIFSALSIATAAGAGGTDIEILLEEQLLERTVTDLGFTQEQKQAAHECAVAYRDYVSHSHELMQLLIDHQRALQNVSNVLARGNGILSDREVFRQRAAAVIQGYRTRDISFRLFRNEALEQYRTLFDLASRYSYLAAKSYDYETGLLGTTQGQTTFKNIVASRSLGDLTGGVPRLTTSSLGDAGLAGSMAKLKADFSVAEGRLGINNPDQNGTIFSMRAEHFRILNDNAQAGDDEAWRQTLEQYMVANLLSDSDVAAQCRNLKKPDGTPVPGIMIPFSTTIQHGRNFFGLEYLPGDHNYTPSNFATKILSVGVCLPGYVGMDVYQDGVMTAVAPNSSTANALGATPYCYLIPCGNDYMLAPPLGDNNLLRSWKVQDQALPLPFNLGANDFNSTQFFSADGTLSEQPWIVRKHQAFRLVNEPSFFHGDTPAEFTNSRLIGRSVWNSQWKLVIPAYSLHSNEQEGLNRFAASVRDIQLFLRTYSNSGN